MQFKLKNPVIFYFVYLSYNCDVLLLLIYLSYVLNHGTTLGDFTLTSSFFPLHPHNLLSN